MRVAITGGTGYIGSMLLRRLQDEGHDAFAVRREFHSVKMMFL